MSSFATFVCCVLRLFNKACSETLENLLDFVFQTAIVVSVKVLHVLNKRVVFLYSKIIILKSYLLFMCYCVFYFKTELFRLGLFLMLEVKSSVLCLLEIEMLLYKILINIKNMQRNNLSQCHTLFRFPLFLMATVGFTPVFLCVVVNKCSQWCSAWDRVGLAPLNCHQSRLVITHKPWLAVSTL